MNRRQFLAAGAGLAVAGRASAIEPIHRHGPAHLKLSLAAYSFNKAMDRRRGAKPTMTYEQFIEFGANCGLSAVELTEYYFPETSPTYLAKLKGMCTRLGLDISGTAISNDFCVSDPAKLKEHIAKVKTWTEHTSRLGGKTMRIFAGTAPRGTSEEKARKQCVEAIQEVCDHAAQFGVFMALENHGGIVTSGEQLLAVVTAVKHDWFGVNLDTGNFRSPDPYADIARAAPYAVVVQVKTDVHPTGHAKEDADLARVVKILRDARFRGYVSLEYEGSKEDPMTAVPKYLKQLGELMKG
jgi:sugar phosphate isomerase/epimerase